MKKMAKKAKLKKTNDERILDQHHIEYVETHFDWINKGKDALAEAATMGVDPKSILKTIVLQANKDPKDYLVVCLPLEYELDLKLVAQQLNKKQVHLADNKNLINNIELDTVLKTGITYNGKTLTSTDIIALKAFLQGLTSDK